MGRWKGIVAKSFTPETFKDYVGKLNFEEWWPDFIVLHNTGEPCLRNRPDGLNVKHMKGLESYYKNTMGWSAGPHLFIDDKQIWVFTPLTMPGVHSPSWNRMAWGIEMLGDYDAEEFDTGRGALVKANSVAAVGILSANADIDPDTMKFHREDKRTTHHCPGSNVKKAEFIKLVKKYIEENYVVEPDPSLQPENK